MNDNEDIWTGLRDGPRECSLLYCYPYLSKHAWVGSGKKMPEYAPLIQLNQLILRQNKMWLIFKSACKREISACTLYNLDELKKDPVHTLMTKRSCAMIFFPPHPG